MSEQMITDTIELPCGCKTARGACTIEASGYQMTVEHCPKHAAVDDLLAACKKAKDLYDYLALGPLGLAVKYGPDHEDRSDESILQVRGDLEAAIAKAEPTERHE